MRQLGQRIRAARYALGVSQAQLAKELRVSQATVGRWEVGQAMPSTERLRPLAVFLNISIEWLLGCTETSAIPATASERNDNARVSDEAHKQRWLAENREAIADANRFIERHGLWSDGKRQF